MLNFVTNEIEPANCRQFISPKTLVYILSYNKQKVIPLTPSTISVIRLLVKPEVGTLCTSVYRQSGRRQPHASVEAEPCHSMPITSVQFLFTIKSDA